MERGEIIGVYRESKDGKVFESRNGNPYLRVTVKVGEQKYYDTFWLTQASYWKIESLFKACGRKSPSFDEFKISDIENLIGNFVLVRVGKDKGGYDTVNLYKPIEPKMEQNPDGGLEQKQTETPPPLDDDEEDDLDDVPF